MQQISRTGVSPRHVPLVLRKRLLLGNVFVKELGLAVKSNKNGTQVIRNVAAGRFARSTGVPMYLGKESKSIGIKSLKH